MAYNETLKFYKILVIGDTTVGKTCLIRRIAENTFTESHLSTMGMDYTNKTITRANNQKLRLRLWDTAGQERYRSVAPALYKGTDEIFLLYTITDRESFIKITTWLTQIKENISQEIPVILLGNKRDMHNEREVEEEEGKALAKENNIHFFEVSAKNGYNIKELEAKAVELLEEMERKMISKGGKEKTRIRGMSLYDTKPKEERSKCCLL